VTVEKAADARIDDIVAKYGRPLDSAVSLADVVLKLIKVERVEEDSTTDWE
jgi:hypothetical protein